MRRNRRGFSLVAVITVGLIMTALALAFITRSTTDTSLVVRSREADQANALVDAGISRGRARIADIFTAANAFNTLRPAGNDVNGTLGGVPPLVRAGGASQVVGEEETFVQPAGGVPYYQFAVDEDNNPLTLDRQVRYTIEELPPANPANAGQANPNNPFGLGCATNVVPVRNGWCPSPGLGFVKTYRITVALNDPQSANLPWAASQAFITVSRNSIFQYAVLYDDDLEIGPGGTMTIRGNVHTNQNAYLYSASNAGDLKFRHLFASTDSRYNAGDSQITSMGNIFNGRKSTDDNGDRAASGANTVSIERANGTSNTTLSTTNGSVLAKTGYVRGDISNPLKGDGIAGSGNPTDTWETNTNWAVTSGTSMGNSTSDFEGRVRTAATGATKVNVPSLAALDPNDPNSPLVLAVNEVPDPVDPTAKGGLYISTDLSNNTLVKKNGVPIALIKADGTEWSVNASGAAVTQRSNSGTNQRFFPEGTFTQAEFYNGREGQTMGTGSTRNKINIKVTDIDVAKLGQAVTRDSNGNSTGAVYPESGLIFATRADAVIDRDRDSSPTTSEDGNPTTPDNQRRPNGIRLSNGKRLPGTSMTLLSNDPVYTLGDFNKHQTTSGAPLDPAASTYNAANDTWKTAVILSDSYTVLSNSWNDANNTSSSRSVQPASNTEVNAVLATGIVTSGPPNDFNGGLQNFPRLIENWGNNSSLTIRGSFVQAWQSRYGTSRWNAGVNGTAGNSYYGVPNGSGSTPGRDWGYDVNFINNPDPVVTERFPGATFIGNPTVNGTVRNYFQANRLTRQQYLQQACTAQVGTRLGWEVAATSQAAGFP